MEILDSAAELPAGRVLSDHMYVKGSPCGSVPLPLSITRAPGLTVWFCPALAVGACIVFVLTLTVAGVLEIIPSFTTSCIT
jgi:hypothetical protein